MTSSKKDNIVHNLNGLYLGLEYDGITTDPAYPGKKFKAFHQGYLKIKDDSVFLDQNPIFVNKTDTSYSASDGGFYYFAGTYNVNDSMISFDFHEVLCDYCPYLPKTKSDGTTEIVKRVKQLTGQLTANGFIIKSYPYLKILDTSKLISEHPEPYLRSLN